jgi:hypothetical protein
MAIIDKPSDYFNTILYTGTGSSLANTGVGFQPDWVWIKGRSGATEHVLTDSVRGVTKELSSNDDGAEETVAQGLTAFGSDGFTVGTDGSYNTSSATYASWNWLANGAGVSNTDGSITSTVSANTTSGFSIVSYTGTTSAGATVGHGLGVTPKMIIVKRLAGGSTNWGIYHEAMGNTATLFFTTGAKDTDVSYWNNTSPTSSVFTLGSSTLGNAANTYIAYCFAEKQGYSKFGSYTGNGNASGPMIVTGMKPAFVIQKNASTGSTPWFLFDNKRNPFNKTDLKVNPNSSDAESAANEIDMLSNGFKVRTSGSYTNASGNSVIYMAFAENPFVTSTGVPATAR